MDSFKHSDGTIVFVSEDNPLPVTATVDVGDVEIGAVEIKDATAATRATVKATPAAAGDAGLVTRAAPETAATATLANVAGSASAVTLIAANTARLGTYIHNDSTAVLYVKYGADASATSFTVKLAAGAFWEMPNRPIYTGLISGLWASATGAARVTEMTA